MIYTGERIHGQMHGKLRGSDRGKRENADEFC